jgi:hypothetical protein
MRIRCLQESVAPGTLPSQGQHPRAVDTSGLLHASDFPVLYVGRGLVGLTIVATQAHELFWTRVCR